MHNILWLRVDVLRVLTVPIHIESAPETQTTAVEDVLLLSAEISLCKTCTTRNRRQSNCPSSTMTSDKASSSAPTFRYGPCAISSFKISNDPFVAASDSSSANRRGQRTMAPRFSSNATTSVRDISTAAYNA